MRLYHQLSDVELLGLLKSGNHLAFEAIYKRYWNLLYRNARKMLSDDEEVNDVVQDIFISLWELPPHSAYNNSLSSYLYSSVRNKIINIINRNKLKDGYSKSLIDFYEKGEYVTDLEVREKELAACIEKEIAQLPDKMRLVFELSRKKNLSYKQIAEEVNISEGTVKKQIYYAIKILRTKFGLFVFVLILIFIKSFF